jgi:hypothetical protein
MRYFKFLLLYFLLPLTSFAQDTLSYPVAVVYYEPTENFYVSNWADGNGFILKLDIQGEPIEKYVDGLHYPGGMCLVGDTLFYTDNLSIWDTLITPSYLKAIKLSNGEELLNYEISTTGTYLDLMDTDHKGNIYIGNSREGQANGIVLKYNITNQQLTNIATGITKPFGVCYDFINDRVLFVQSTGTLSFVKSVSPNGGTVTNVFYINGYLEGLFMHPNGDIYLSSWGTFDGAWGNEPIYKANHAMDWSTILESNHNRPFGMCVGKDNHLVVCNWGSNSLSFINLNDFGIEEYSLNPADLLVFPNPSHGNITLNLKNTGNDIKEICVQDLTGSVVYRASQHISNNFECQIDLNHLKAGSYILNLYGSKGIIREKLVIY